MERHVQNAVVVANWLEARDEVSWVAYPGLASSPWHERQLQYLPRGGGSIIAFGIKETERRTEVQSRVSNSSVTWRTWAT